MEVRQRIERGLAQHEQVHQLAVVRQQRVVAARGDRRAGPSLVADAQRQDAAIVVARDRRGRVERPVEDELAVTGRLCRPPPAAAPERRAPENTAMPAMLRRARRRRTASGSAPGGSTLSRTALPMIVRRPAVRNRPSPPSSAPSHGGHRALLRRQRNHRDDDAAGAGWAVDRDGHLVRVRRHEPEFGRIRVRDPREPGGAGSGGGAPFRPTFHCPARTVTR